MTANPVRTTTIREHEPSRSLFLVIAHAARGLAQAETRDDFYRALFALDDALFPDGISLEYVVVMTRRDRLIANVTGKPISPNDEYTFDARFFLPQGLAPHMTFIRRLNRRLAQRCKDWAAEHGTDPADRKELHAYDGMTLGLKPETRAGLVAAADALEGYFAGIHVGGQRP